MHTIKRTRRLALALVLALAASHMIAASATFAPTISRWVVDTGGDTSAGGSYTLSATAGQAEAGPVLSGGAYQLTSGYWAAAAGGAAHGKTYIPIVSR